MKIEFRDKENYLIESWYNPILIPNQNDIMEFTGILYRVYRRKWKTSEDNIIIIRMERLGDDEDN